MTRIAIIEDDPPTSQSFATWLKEYDESFEIEQLGSRAAAEAAIAQRAFDLVVLDIRMGSDSNAGVGLIHDLGKRQNCPVIVVSGMPADIYRGIMYQLEAWDYLTKPADQAALLTRATETLTAEAVAAEARGRWRPVGVVTVDDVRGDPAEPVSVTGQSGGDGEGGAPLTGRQKLLAGKFGRSP